jgi:hypothetical protein
MQELLISSIAEIQEFSPMVCDECHATQNN